MKLTQKKNKGFTLIEILLVVGFIALASVGVYTIYSKVQVSNAANAESRNIDLIRAGVKTLYASQTTYTGLTAEIINNARITPDNMKLSATTIGNSFGGAVTVLPIGLNTGTNNGFYISYAKVPGAVCTKLASSAAAQFDVVSVSATAGDISGNVKAFGTSAINVANLTTACMDTAGTGVTMTFASL